MKQIGTAVILLLGCLTLSFCNGQNKAVEDQKKAFDAMSPYMPKTVPPGDGIYMKASINGKPWEATGLIPDKDPGTSYHVNGEKNGVRIAFYIARSYLKEGVTHKFGEGSVADFMYNDDVVFYGSETGSYTITRVDAQGFDATFHFTATSNRANGNVFEVTDGTLRFPFPVKK